MNVRRPFQARVIVGQRFYGLKRVQSAVFIIESRNRRVQFLNHVGKFSIRMKRKMSRTRARCCADERRIAWRKLPRLVVERKSHDFVRTQIGNEHVFVVRRDVN